MENEERRNEGVPQARDEAYGLQAQEDVHALHVGPHVLVAQNVHDGQLPVLPVRLQTLQSPQKRRRRHLTGDRQRHRRPIRGGTDLGHEEARDQKAGGIRWRADRHRESRPVAPRDAAGRILKPNPSPRYLTRAHPHNEPSWNILGKLPGSP